MKKKMVVLLMLILSVSTAVLHGTCEEIQTIIAVVTDEKRPAENPSGAEPKRQRAG